MARQTCSSARMRASLKGYHIARAFRTSVTAILLRAICGTNRTLICVTRVDYAQVDGLSFEQFPVMYASLIGERPNASPTLLRTRSLYAAGLLAATKGRPR